MPDSVSSSVALGIELLIAAIGLILLWRFKLGVQARANPAPAVLPIWIIRTSEFFLFLCCICAGGVLTSVVGTLLAKFFIKDNDTFLVIAGAAFHPGLILGAFIFVKYLEKPLPIKPLAGRIAKPLKAGVITFLIALPLVLLTSVIWQSLMRYLNIPVEQQPLVERLLKSNDPVMIATLMIFAIGIGPIAEELVFRFGLFRFARGRLPNWLAFVLPALAFATLHQNLASFGALVVLAIVLSAAYQRTGHIAVPIIAHALFNLNSIVMLLAGVKN